jgi:hypothetical protein
VPLVPAARAVPVAAEIWDQQAKVVPQQVYERVEHSAARH